MRAGSGTPNKAHMDGQDGHDRGEKTDFAKLVCIQMGEHERRRPFPNFDPRLDIGIEKYYTYVQYCAGLRRDIHMDEQDSQDKGQSPAIVIEWDNTMMASECC